MRKEANLAVARQSAIDTGHYLFASLASARSVVRFPMHQHGYCNLKITER